MTEDPQRQPDDDPTVPNDDVLQRRLPSAVSSWVAIDQETGTRRPSSSAFKPDADGVSVYRDQLLRNASLSVMDLVRSPENLVVGVTVADVRSIHLGVRDDIWPPDGIPTWLSRAKQPTLSSWASSSSARTSGDADS